MNVRLGNAIQMTALLILGGGLTACGELLTTSRLTTSDPFDGRSWSETIYLEPNSENPSDGATPAVLGFEGQQVPGADDFWLAASFFNRTSGQFEGYARRYQPGAGWASAGDDFRVVTSASGFSAGAAQISIDSSGGVLAAFIELDSLGSVTRMASAYRSTSWKSLGVQTLDGAISLPGLSDSATLLDTSFGLQGAWPMDLLLSSQRPGIGYFFTAQIPTSSSVLSGVHWSAGSGFDSDLVSTDREIVSSVSGAASPVLIRQDSGGGFCLFTEGPDISDSSLSVVHAQCSDADSLLSGDFADGTSLGSAFSPSADSSTDASISGNELSSGLFDAAFDGSETLLSIFYRYDDEGVPQLYSRARVSGVWEDMLVQISGSVTSAYTSAFENSFPIRPAVIALSEGRFLAVWAAYDLNDFTMNLYYSVRDAGGAWSREKAAGVQLNWAETGVVNGSSVLDGLWLYSNLDGEAALAVRYLGDVTSDMTDTFDVSRKWLFLRFSDETGGWDIAATRARPGYEEDGLVGCVPSDVGMNHCTQPPSGAVFSDGSSVLVFPTEDNEGRARLGSVVYQ